MGTNGQDTKDRVQFSTVNTYYGRRQRTSKAALANCCDRDAGSYGYFDTQAPYVDLIYDVKLHVYAYLRARATGNETSAPKTVKTTTRKTI